MIERRRLLSLPPPPLPLGHRLTLSLLLLVVCGLLTSVRAKYIFTEEPLARDSPAAGIDSYDLFGYAAALHRVDDSGGSQDFEHAIQNTKIIVGAPNGTFPGGVSFSGVNASDAINQTGLVYECPITPGECGPLRGSGNGNDIRLFDYEGNSIDIITPKTNENKEGQFMGATIISSGEHILICAPRWRRVNVRGLMAFQLTLGHGRCYVAPRDLAGFDLLRPCDGGIPSAEVGESYCMAGTSAAIQEKQGTSYDTYLGSPPFQASNGAVFEYERDVNSGSSFGANRQFDHLAEFVYGGFSVALGRISGSIEQDLVSSLPKSDNYRGSVWVFNGDTNMREFTVNGLQMGEYFGWTVATADLNGDGFDELLVGAPLFSTFDRIEKGRVFIYRNNGTLDTGNPIILPGTARKGRFGSAIVNLGDINSDGFEDIAVSAPYEEHTTDTEGTVYVYLGSGESYLNPTYEDRITAQEISSNLGDKNLRTFGYSMSSGVDVDANHNNDLVIGGYKSQTIVVLRTHSIANVSLSLTTDPSELFDYTNDNCALSFGSFPCFNLMINASFSGRGLTNRSLVVNVAVSENPVDTGSRIFFVDSKGIRIDTYHGTINFTTTDVPVTTPVTVYVEDDIVDRRSNLKMIVGLLEMEREKRDVNGSQNIVDLRVTPLLNVLPKNNTEIELSLTGCEMPTMCKPDVELILNKTTYRMTDSLHDVTINASPETEVIEVTLSYRTLTDDASGSFILFEFDKNVFDSPSLVVEGNEMCITNSSGAWKCYVEPIFSDYEGNFTVTIAISIRTDLLGDEADTTIQLSLMPGNDTDPVPGNNGVTLNVDITAVNRVTIQSVTVSPQDTLYQDTNKIGDQEISIRVNLVAEGPSTIPDSSVTINIPGILPGQEFYYLYPAFNTTSSSSDVGAITCDGLNPENLEEYRRTPDPARRRRRRHVRSLSYMEAIKKVWTGLTGREDEEEEEGEMMEMHKRQETTNNVNCAKTPELCTAQVKCTMNNFRARIFTISITVAVDNRRAQSSDVELVMSAEYNITTPFFPLSTQGAVSSDPLRIRALTRGVEEPIPVYIYVVSVLIAIIIITLMIIALFLLVICLRRRTKKKFRRATERRRSRHTTTGTSVATGTTGGGGAVVTSLDTKPDDENLDDKPKPEPPSGTDQPDATVEESTDDPDETEL